jgi:DNA-binding CsgD family transcriptional regulator
LDLEQRNEELDREVQLRIRAEQSLQRALASPVLLIDRRGAVQFRSTAAERLLTCHGGQPAAVQLRTWHIGAEEREVAGSSGRLFVRRVPDPANTDQALFVLAEKAPPATPELLLTLGLTPREAEILFWIAQGKTSPEIAVILETAPATVKRHVHHILSKLGVETRLAAALRAMEVLGLPG